MHYIKSKLTGGRSLFRRRYLKVLFVFIFAISFIGQSADARSVYRTNYDGFGAGFCISGSEDYSLASLCTPLFFYGCTDDYLEEFHLSGENGSEISRQVFSCDGEYVNLSSESVELSPGSTYGLSAVTTYSSDLVTIWLIDENGQATLVTASFDAGGGATADLVVPPSLPGGEYTLRIMVTFSDVPVNECDPGDFAFGQTVDYTAILPLASSCSGAPAGGTASVNPSSGNPNSAYTVSSSGYENSLDLEYQWQSSTNSGSWTDEGPSSGTYSPFAAIAPGVAGSQVEWRLRITCTNGNSVGYSTTATFIVTEAIYCKPSYSYSGDRLSKVVTSGASSDINYTNSIGGVHSDQTAIVLEAFPNQQFDLTTTYFGGVQTIGIWIDWNKDGNFADAGFPERYALSNSSSADQTFSIQIPGGIGSGDYIIRVRGSFDFFGDMPAQGDAFACNHQSYGSSADFTLRVSLPPGCAAPINLVVDNISDHTADISWTAIGSETDWIIAWGEAGFDPDNEGDTDEVQTTPAYTIQGLDPGVSYEVYVKADCGSEESAWSVKVAFNTFEELATLPYNHDFSFNDFSFVNGGQANKWAYGSAAGNPENAIYISNNGGANNAYSTPNSSVAHAYRDFIIPPASNYAVFSFDWRGVGERFNGANYDYMRVWLTPSSFNPQAGVQITAGNGRIQVGDHFNQQSTWETYTNPSLDLSSFSGQIMRLVFEWRNDASGGAQPPAGVDNISLELYQDCEGVSDPGQTFASVASACSGVNFELSLENIFSESGITYQWESADDQEFTSNVVQLGTASVQTTSQSSPRWYRCVVACEYGGSESSTPVFVNLEGACQCSSYCSTSNGSGGACIVSVDLNTLAATTAACVPPPGYTLKSETTTLLRGITYSLTVTTNLEQYEGAIVSAWFDWNGDGFFDATEWTQVFTSGSTGSVNINVPVSAITGETRMRIRSRGTGNANGPGDACSAMGSGTTEDYCIHIEDPTPCAGVPVGGTAMLSASSGGPYSGYTVSATGYELAADLEFQWQSSTNAGPWINEGPVGNTYSDFMATAPANIGNEVKWRLKITCTNGGESGYSATAAFIVIGTCNWTIHVWSEGYGDLTSWTLKDEADSIILSGGSYSYNFDDTLSIQNPGPVSFSISDWGPLKDNLAYFTVSNDHGILVSGQVGSDPQTFSNLSCSDESLLPCAGVPNGGYASFDSESGPAGSIVHFEVGGYSTAPDLSYNWEVSTNEGLTWESTGESNNEGYLILTGAIGTVYKYRYAVYCPNSDETGYSNVVSFTITVGCIPIYDEGCIYSDYIREFTLNGANSTSIVKTNGGCEDGFYYLDETSSSVELVGGLSYLANILAGAPGDYATIWLIDNSWDAIQVTPTTAVDDLSGGTDISLDIPNLPAGAYRLRVMLEHGATPPSDECTPASTKGQTIDFTANVSEFLACAIVCPPDISIDADGGVCGAIVEIAVPVIEGYCEGESLQNDFNHTNNASGFYPVGITEVTFSISEQGSNDEKTCHFFVSVEDQETPAISCPADIEFTLNPGEVGMIVNYDLPIASDNCQNPLISLTSGLASGSTFPIGITDNCFEAEDASGNTANCCFKVTIIEGIPCTLVCPDNIEVNNAPGLCGAVVEYQVEADHCSAVTSSTPSGSEFPVGATVVTVEADDESCIFTVTVNDLEVPAIVCPDNIEATTAPGENTVVVNYADPAFVDNCPGAALSLVSGLASGSDFPLGATDNCFRAEDASGNSATCCFRVSIHEGEEDACPDNLNITGTIPGDTYQAAQNISSDGTVPEGATVIFKAGTGILLESGFEVKAEAVFEALIEVCTPFAPEPTQKK